jgi:DNA-binding response OmpR family regulator
MRILIADDEKMLVSMLAEFLRQNRIDTDAVFNGADCIYNAVNNEYDLIILDIMMPKKTGFEVIKELRAGGIDTPVLFLSAKSETADKVDGLNLGADDYLVKPFSAEELLARVKALTRRKGEYIGNAVKFGDITLDKDNFTLCGIKLTNIEFKIMEALITKPEKIINKDALIEKVWGWDDNTCYNNIEVYISFLRKKLAALKSKVRITTFRGVGYAMAVAE